MLSPQQDSLRSIYFIAICGTGMTALAGLLKSIGYQVSGSDQNIYPPMSTFLHELGIPIHSGFDPKHLNPPPDLVVIGNAMSRGNPEVEFVLDKKLNYISLPFALREFFIRGKYSCVVAGTHGKTTTSSMLAWVLEHAGMDPSFFIGGIPENFGQGFKVGKGRHFVTEGDEYDSAFFDKGPKFLHYLPDLVILNNIEFDHADIFNNIDEIEVAFKRLINLIPSSGYLVACWDDPTVRRLSAAAFSNVVSYGLNDEADWQARNVVVAEDFTEFEVVHKAEHFLDLQIPLHGEHMMRNSLAVVAACQALGVKPEKIGTGLKTFANVRRRLQLCGESNGVLIFDDFAHHPTEVEATIDSLRERFPDRRIWALYQPRTATSKRKIFQDQYAAAFDRADCVILTPLHAPEKVPEGERLSVEVIREKIANRNKPVQIMPPNAEMLRFLRDHIREGDVVLFMSNGDFNQMPNKLLEVM
ncbi:UDP-N-acetylmuramate:L-alanyl-gamma-D-glutamyl-meso-diaminopimelate ligase [bacterium]|nr:UDP-N-acetylmuramate:L-alanyl-gamma-D-glutamyl-meso-diaminopimelate ligase [bacterium]